VSHRTNIVILGDFNIDILTLFCRCYKLQIYLSYPQHV